MPRCGPNYFRKNATNTETAPLANSVAVDLRDPLVTVRTLHSVPISSHYQIVHTWISRFFYVLVFSFSCCFLNDSTEDGYIGSRGFDHDDSSPSIRGPNTGCGGCHRQSNAMGDKVSVIDGYR